MDRLARAPWPSQRLSNLKNVFSCTTFRPNRRDDEGRSEFVERSRVKTDDRLFVIFAIGSATSVATLIAFAYNAAGWGAPSPLFIAGHLVLSLWFRASYKSCDVSSFTHHFTLGLFRSASPEPGALAPLLEWNDGLSLGVPSIDEQHQKLVVKANALAEALASGESESTLTRLFEDLLAYSKTHSEFEEALFEDHSLAGALEHRAEHENLMDQAREFKASFGSGSGAARRYLTEFLGDWMTDHISKGDKAFAEQLRSRGIV